MTIKLNNEDKKDIKKIICKKLNKSKRANYKPEDIKDLTFYDNFNLDCEGYEISIQLDFLSINVHL